MWVFRCKYQRSGQSGTLQNISCALYPEGEFIVGRASKSTLVIEEKGVSRTHLRLDVIDDHVSVLLLGSQLRVGGEDTSKGSALRFAPSQSPVLLEVGSHSVHCILEWTQWEFKIPSTLFQEDPDIIEEIKGSGIRVATSFSKATSHHIIKPHEDDQAYDKYLFALVKGIPILNLGFLKDIAALLRQPVTDFDTQMRSIQEQHYAFPASTTKATDLTGLHFIVNRKNDFEMLKYTLERGGGTVHFCHNSNDLGACLKTLPAEGIIALRYNNGISTEGKKADDIRYYEVLQAYGIGCYTVDELAKAILNDNLASLLSKRPLVDANLVESIPPDIPQTQDMKQESTQPSVLENSVSKDLPHKDKARKRLRKPQPLDSLSFFAGGLSRQNSSIGGTADVVKQESIGLGADTEYGSTSDIPPPSATQSPKKRRRPKVEPLENLMTSQLQKAFIAPTTPIAKESSTQQDIIQALGSKPGEPYNDTDAISDASYKSGTELASRKRQLSRRSPDEPLPHGASIGDSSNKQLTPLHNEPLPKKTKLQDTDLNADNIPENTAEPGDILTQSKLDSPEVEHINSRKRASSEDHIKDTKRQKAHIVPEQNIVDAIKQIKEREVNRIRTTIVELAPEELTEDAIRQLQSLAIVQPTDMLRKQAVDTDAPSPSPLGRKNFKKFNKVWPTYMNRSSAPQTRNAMATISREYLPLEPYDSEFQSRTAFEEAESRQQKSNTSRSPTIDSLSNNIAINSGRDHSIHRSALADQTLPRNDGAGSEPSFNFSSRSRQNTSSPTVSPDPNLASPSPNLAQNNTLFVVDDEVDEDGTADMSIAQRVSRERQTTKPPESDTPEPPRTRRKHARKSKATEDSDDDEEEPTFAFKRAR
ncbi:AaceriAER402Cp [[Ashbya] aceris (nom. inval.)]|nr:AaceriAER402Cp [[Ashbya] aceris (nom. inval.)]